MMAGIIGGNGASAFPDPSFVRLPADWQNGLARNGALFAAFRRVKPDAFERYPKDRSEAAGAWPSPRSWTNACIAYTALEAITELHERDALGFHAIGRLLEADRRRAEGVPHVGSAFRPAFYTEARCRHYYAAWKRIIAWEGLEKALGLTPKPPQ